MVSNPNVVSSAYATSMSMVPSASQILLVPESPPQERPVVFASHTTEPAAKRYRVNPLLSKANLFGYKPSTSIYLPSISESDAIPHSIGTSARIALPKSSISSPPVNLSNVSTSFSSSSALAESISYANKPTVSDPSSVLVKPGFAKRKLPISTSSQFRSSFATAAISTDSSLPPQCNGARTDESISLNSTFLSSLKEIPRSTAQSESSAKLAVDSSASSSLLPQSYTDEPVVENSSSSQNQIENSSLHSDVELSKLDKGPAKTRAKRKKKTDGMISQNFVRMNLRAKRYRSSKRPKMNNSFHKRNKKNWIPFDKWKAMQDETNQDGLFAELMDDQEARKMKRTLDKESRIASKRSTDLEVSCGDSTDEEKQGWETHERELTGKPTSLTIPSKSYIPTFDQLFTLADDGTTPQATNSLTSILSTHFGHTEFRSGQIEAIYNILNPATPTSTLLIMPTGAGKSLCYMLPSLFLPGITLCVSPLIALMDDQCSALPDSIPGRVWNSSMDYHQVLALMADIRNNRIKILFISPEKVSSHSFFRFISTLPPPGISFVAIDEAHCVSQWSHNFRPSYLHIRAAIESMSASSWCTTPIRTLAITATATKEAEEKIKQSLRCSQVLRVNAQRKNIRIHVEKVDDSQKELRLLTAIECEQYAFCMGKKQRQNGSQKRARNSRHVSLLIYVQYQRQAEVIASFLSSHGYEALTYHAGIGSAIRKRRANDFTSNRVPILVATIAFGMGIDKADIDGVIHMYMPQSIDAYVQEIGRAGRDGRICDTLMIYSDSDITNSLAHIEKSLIKERFIRKLIYAIMRNDTNLMRERNSGEDEVLCQRMSGEYVALSIDELMKTMSMTEETASTILSHLALSLTPPYIKMFQTFHSDVEIGFLRLSADQLSCQSTAIKGILQLTSSSSTNGCYQCSLPALANHLKESILNVQRELVRLRSLREIRVRWSNPSIVCEILRSEPDDAALENLTRFVLTQIRSEELRRRKQLESMQIFVITIGKQLDNVHDLFDFYYNYPISTTINRLLQNWNDEEKASISHLKILQT